MRPRLYALSARGPNSGCRQPDLPRAPTRELLAYFDGLHRDTLGVPAVIQGGKDAKLLSGLWRSHGDELTKALMADFFASTDPFIRDNGYTVGRFLSQAGKLLVRHVRQRQVSVNVDWWEDCKARHQGACGGQYKHAVRTQIETDRAAS